MRIILYNNAVPEMRLWLITGGLAAGASLVGLLVYHKLKKNFVSFY
jgi:ABC-type polysaccharide/polyol phosphate export permease